MRTVNAREAHILRASWPGGPLVEVETDNDNDLLDALQARGFLRIDAEEVYWTTPLGMLAYALATDSGGASHE